MAFTLHQLLSACARHSPEQLAVIGPKHRVSYLELDQRSDALAAALIASGVLPGDPVGIAMHKCIDAIVGVYGVLKAGACYVPIDVFAPAQRSAAIVANTKLSTLLTTPDRVKSLVAELCKCPEASSLSHVFVPPGDVSSATATPAAASAATSATRAADEDEHVAESPAEVLCATWPMPGNTPPSLPDITDTHLAYVLHTSGSTGTPKGVAITHRNALCFVESASAYWNVRAEDRLCSQAPLHFDLSVFDLFVAARASASVVLIPEFYAAFPKKMASAIDEHGITIWNSVVSTLTLMMERGKPEAASFSSLRAVIFSGEIMPLRYLRKLHKHMETAVFYNVYGQTEANSSLVFAVDRSSLPTEGGYKVPLGKALPNFEVFALDEGGKNVCKPGETGELVIRAHTVASGYWGNPKLTSEKFPTDPRCQHLSSGARVYKTGDRAFLDTDGNFHFAGRSDDMIKSRGYRIELGEIDLALLSCPHVESAAAVALPDEEVGNRIFAFATLVSDSSLGEREILAHCRARIPKYMLPETLFIRQDLPRTSTNKIDRKALVRLVSKQQKAES